jgi:hypothetical protein
MALATACPKSFTCAFSAAETMSTVTPRPNIAGQPDVYLGYMSFDGATPPNVTLTGISNINGQINTSISMSGTCADSAQPLQPAIITFTPAAKETPTQISFVTDNGGIELQFILTQDSNSTSTSVSNSVRIGVCRQQ